MQTRLMIAHERALEVRLAQAIAAAGRRAAVAAQHGEDTDRATASLADEMARVLAPSLAETARTFGARVIEGPKSASAFLGLERKAFADLDQAIRQHVWVESARRVVNVSHSLRLRIRQVIQQGVAENLGQEEVAARIVEATSGEIGMARARRIARTEVHNAAMFGQQAAADASPLAFDKVWLATEDARTRESHARANGQRVALDERFVLQAEDGPPVLLRYPGDTEGPPGEVINCRCVCLYEPKPVARGGIVRQQPAGRPVDISPQTEAEIDAAVAELPQWPPPPPDLTQDLPTVTVTLPPAASDAPPLPERDLVAVPFERAGQVVYAAGSMLVTQPDGAPSPGSTVRLLGPNTLYDTADAPEVDTVIAAQPAGIRRRPVLWRVTLPGGATLPDGLVSEHGGGLTINSGVGGLGVVTLTVNAVRRQQWGQAAPKPQIAADTFETFVRDRFVEALRRLQGLDPILGTPAEPERRTAREVAAWLVNQIRGADILSGGLHDFASRVPQSVIRTLADTRWTRRGLEAYLEQLLAGDVQDEPDVGEPAVDDRVLVVEATANLADAIPRGTT